jgi:hypothetical protein
MQQTGVDYFNSEDNRKQTFNVRMLRETVRLLIKVGCAHLAPQQVTLGSEGDVDQLKQCQCGSARLREGPES